MAFFSSLVDLFQNYEEFVSQVPGDREIFFDSKPFINKSDSNHKKFYTHFLQIDETGA